ncbi:MAG: DUF4132 domain-containing protein [Eubacterium sp.]|nr:DUF4132 domain-containing protein [Eubacterium sp.]
MGDFDYSTRREITIQRTEALRARMKKYAGRDADLIAEAHGGYLINEAKAVPIVRQFYKDPAKKPSEWFQKGAKTASGGKHQGLLEVFVPKQYQGSYLYIIDKLNQFSFSSGWNRRTVRTAGYGPQMGRVFALLIAYEKLFYCGERLEDFIYRRLDAEKMDYIRHEWGFTQNFSLIYAAEIDRGNQAVIEAFEDLILSENNTSYLDREMILGIFQSDHKKLRQLVCDLLVAARLQEGLRQAVCETADEGTKDAFLAVLRVIEENGLIRYASVKRAVSVWIGIFDENNVDRINGKLLALMGECLRDAAFCRKQLQTNDSIAVSVALWALGFDEAETAVDAVMKLIGNGTKNQKLTASYYNQSLFDEKLKMRAARKAVLEYADDLELVAAFMPAYTARLSGYIQGLLYGKQMHSNEPEKPRRAVLEDYYKDEQDARRHYETFWNIYQRLPKKGVVYDPCIFPWYRVELKPSEAVCEMAFAAYVLQDEEKITQAAGLLGEITVGSYMSERAALMHLLLYQPSNQAQRELLIGYMGNAEEYTSSKAITLVKKLELREPDYRLIEDMLRFKRSRLRSELLDFLMGQEDAGMEQCLKRLLSDKKEEKRTAGLDLLLRLSKKTEKAAFYEAVKPYAQAIEKPTDKEKVLLEEILGERTLSAADQKGFGIYNPDAPVDIPKLDVGRDKILECLPLPEQEIIDKIKKLDALIYENRNFEYDAAFGGKQILENGYAKLADTSGEDRDFSGYRLKNYPLEEKLRAYYETEIGDYGTFIEWEARILLTNNEIFQNSRIYYEAVFGKMPFEPLPMELTYADQVQKIRLNYRYEFLDRRLLLEAGVQAAQALLPVMNEQNRAVCFHYSGWNGQSMESFKPICDLHFLQHFLDGLSYWETDEEFTKAFYTAWALELKCSPAAEKSRFLPQDRNSYTYRITQLTPIKTYWFLKAYHMGLISRDHLFQAVLVYFNRRENLRALTQLVQGEYAKRYNLGKWKSFFGSRMGLDILERGEALVGKDTWCGRLVKELYDAIVPLMVDTELRRGEAETVFSEDIGGITYIAGTEYLVRILKALGKDTLGRDAYYTWYSGNSTKKEVLSCLLRSCYPAKEDTAETLAQALKGTSIRQERLVEAAMYAPQWIGLIEQYLGWAGLKSGCYYFMAHMNERFDDQKAAMIARYTPLSTEELRDGAFDIDWFREAYGMLGEQNFAVLYKAAKYIADGLKHARARKYADAATGKVTLKELREQIAAKRNKDLLMSYGLVPFGKKMEKDLLERYQFIQNFAKEARQFGAQRRASETKAAQMALLNLSMHAGYADVTRLTLNMEGRMAEEFAPMMSWKAVDDVEICLHIDENGKSAVLCRKGEKMLKSVPSRLGKQAYVQQVKEAHKKLKEQYQRAKKLMEESMEDGEGFTAAEAAGLMGNPVVRAILRPLVFAAGKETDKMEMGFFEALDSSMWLCAYDGKKKKLKADDKIRIAHPLDFYRAGVWHSYQKYLFDHQIRQPFKQVFRELYVKLPEELSQKSSRMFAGNQIQPRKTAACLKGRRWIADYEEGLQKIYYKENIIVRIYALADWFSPSDVEAPTLEWVEFSDRKTFEPLSIGQVPDLIYSEAMRDVDLAISVAHAGGVDPQTSHSTIEMRRAIVEFNLPLFRIENVALKDSHALIHGTRANYNVHLGSGVVHQEGGAMLHILPVHSQRRGKLFLPFVDEDPKTAEILSKIVLLAEDQKIRDPFILEQIQG